MFLIIWTFSQTLNAVDPYGEYKKKMKEKQHRSIKKNYSVLELFIAVGHAAIKISKFLIVFE